MGDGRKGVGLEGEGCKKLQFYKRNILGCLFSLLFLLLTFKAEGSFALSNLENPDEDVSGNPKGAGSRVEFLVP